MQRISYDADTQVYTYQDADGTLWEGAPGARYGVLKRGIFFPPFLSREDCKLTDFFFLRDTVQTLPTLPEEVNNPPSPSPSLSTTTTNHSGQFKNFDQLDMCQCQCERQDEKKSPFLTSLTGSTVVANVRKKHHECERGRGLGRGRFLAVLFLQVCSSQHIPCFSFKTLP